jgi:integrase/recombinase XerD
MSIFSKEFRDTALENITSDEILSFLGRITDGLKPGTKRIRYAHLSAFFNFVKNNLIQELTNPLDSPMLRKLFRAKAPQNWDFIDKDTMDEIIFRTTKTRNRLILELMARSGMRIGEVLKLTCRDIGDRKLILRDPKSGRENEIVFIPKRVYERLQEYARASCNNPDDSLFPISYEAARVIVARAGMLVNIKLRPHDLRRHAATYASRSGVPIEVVSKIILRHANLSTTQLYLGKISETEAMSWIDNLYR